jgi:hypothetical protein
MPDSVMNSISHLEHTMAEAKEEFSGDGFEIGHEVAKWQAYRWFQFF